MKPLVLPEAKAPVTPHSPIEEVIELHEETGNPVSFFLEIAPPPPSEEDCRRVGNMVIVMTGDPTRLLALKALVDSAFI